MKIKTVIMSNGREYNLLWDDSATIDHDLEGSFKMIDLEKGWIELNPEFVSEIIPSGKLKSVTKVSSKARKEITEHYGPEVFMEEETPAVW